MWDGNGPLAVGDFAFRSRLAGCADPSDCDGPAAACLFSRAPFLARTVESPQQNRSHVLAIGMDGTGAYAVDVDTVRRLLEGDLHAVGFARRSADGALDAVAFAIVSQAQHPAAIGISAGRGPHIPCAVPARAGRASASDRASAEREIPGRDIQHVDGHTRNGVRPARTRKHARHRGQSHACLHSDAVHRRAAGTAPHRASSAVSRPARSAPSRPACPFTGFRLRPGQHRRCILRSVRRACLTLEPVTFPGAAGLPTLRPWLPALLGRKRQGGSMDPSGWGRQPQNSLTKSPPREPGRRASAPCSLSAQHPGPRLEA